MASEIAFVKCRWQLCNTLGSVPQPRCAHALILKNDTSLLLLGGDTGIACKRLSDLWILTIPNEPVQGRCQWQCCSASSSAVDADAEHAGPLSPASYDARSNLTAVAAGDNILVFGGWDWTGTTPLARLQLLNRETLLPLARGPADPTETAAAASNSMLVPGGGWDQEQQQAAWQQGQINVMASFTQASADGCALPTSSSSKAGPCPRGQPTAVATTDQRSVLLFGGWDGTRRFNDLWLLDLISWDWHLVEPACESLPPARADHSMVLWYYCDDGVWKDLLVVLGGSSAGGLLGDLWLYDTKNNIWTQAYPGGVAPCARSSHAAAVVGDLMLLVGGQAQGHVLQDCHLLNLSNLTWIQVSLDPPLPPRCRHTLTCCQDHAWLFGGYDGRDCHNSLIEIDLGPVLQMKRSKWEGPALPEEHQLGCNSANKVLVKAAALPPMALPDLEDADKLVGTPSWKQIRSLHQAAVAAERDMYVDPATGYTVFTSHYLKQRPCCGNKCRHCPHGWKNVAKRS